MPRNRGKTTMLLTSMPLRSIGEAIEPDESIDAREKERLRRETINAVCTVPLRGGGSESTD